MTDVRRTLNDALRLCGFSPDTYDADAIIGRLEAEGWHLMDEDETTRALFDDRCDFECSVCHPTDDIKDLPIIDLEGNPL